MHEIIEAWVNRIILGLVVYGVILGILQLVSNYS